MRRIDLRGEAPEALPRSNVVNGKTVLRDPEKITGVCVHQMGTEFGLSPRQLAASDGDAIMAKARRFMKVPAHACASIDGFYSVHADLRHYLNHGHSFNRDTLGLEIEGKYQEFVDNPYDDISWVTVEAAREALRYLVTEGRAMGMPIRYVYGHRQSYKVKSSDPGEAIWREVVLWGVKELELVARPNYKRGLGGTIPERWYATK